MVHCGILRPEQRGKPTGSSGDVLDGAKDRESPDDRSTSAKHFWRGRLREGEALQDGSNAGFNAF